MDCDKKCPLKASRKCTQGKCELWITDVIEARPEQCTKTLYAKDFMSQKDYMDLVRLSLLSAKVGIALNDTTLALGQLGKASIFHPIKSKKINAKQIEIQNFNKHLKGIEALRATIFARYEKVRKSLVVGLLRKGGFNQTYERYDDSSLSWELGGVRLGEDQVIGRCLLTESATEVTDYLQSKRLLKAANQD